MSPIPRHQGPYGSQTLIGPCWPDIDEDEIAAAAQAFEQLAMHVTGVVVPQLHGQMAQLASVWEGLAATAALGEAGSIVSGHESNAALASAIALKLRKMEAVVAKTKTMVNMTATETETACQAAQNAPGAQMAIQGLIMAGRSQNIAHLMEATAELGDSLGVPVNPAVPIPPATLGPVEQVGKAAQQAGDAAGQAGGGGGKQMTQMLGQLTSQVGQAPQALGKMFGGAGLQPLTQPLQALSSMFGQLGKGGAAPSPFSAFSNHPAAGGSGPKAGGGLGHGGSVPGAGGSPPRTPLMAKLVDKHTTVMPTAVEPGAVAGTTVTAGVAPVGAGGGMGGMGGMGMMGHRESSGGTKAGLSVPSPLEHDLTEDDEDDEW